MLRHPWLAVVASSRTTLGPHDLWWTETSLSAFDGLQLGPDDMLAALQTLSSFVLGHVLGELADGEAARRTGLTHEQWMERQGEYGDAVVADDRHPRLSRIMVEAAAPHAADRQERAFEAGLARALDGIGAHLPGVTAPGT